jgi:Cyclin, N-terminal domain
MTESYDFHLRSYFLIPTTFTATITMNTFQETIEEAVARMEAMRYQEETGYAIFDYLSSSQCKTNQSEENIDIMYDVDADCRTKMAMWCYQVIDFCKFSRETAQISMSYLDRYLLSDEGSVALFDRSLFQLVSMTALYTAVKIHEPEAMDPKLVANLSRGLYSVDEIEEMERDMLTAINWRVNPPTSMSFCREFLNIIPEDALPSMVRDQVSDLAKAQIESAFYEHEYMTVKSSTIAFCSFMNAIETLVDDERLLACIGCVLSEAIGADCNSDDIVRIQLQLYDAVIAGSDNKCRKTDTSPIVPRREVARTISPRSITGI